MRLYAHTEAAMVWAEHRPDTVGWMSRMRACFPIEELGVCVPLVEKAGSTSAFWALLARWMPEACEEGRARAHEAVEAGDELGRRMVRDILQERVCLRRPEEVAKYQMVALMREPVERWWSAWAHQCHRNAYGRTVALRRRVPKHAEEAAAVHWLMEQDPGTIDEHMAPQWSTLSLGATVHPLTEAGVRDFCEATGLESLPHHNSGQAEGRTTWRRPGGPLDETVRWLYGTDAAVYAQAVAGEA